MHIIHFLFQLTLPKQDQESLSAPSLDGLCQTGPCPGLLFPYFALQRSLDSWKCTYVFISDSFYQICSKSKSVCVIKIIEHQLKLDLTNSLEVGFGGDWVD